MTKENNQAVKISDLFASEEASFELRPFLFRYILRRWYFYLFFSALAVGLVWLYLRYTPPLYQIKCSLLIKDDSETNTTGISEEAIFKDLGILKGSKNLENEIQILKSETLMQEVMRKLGLNIEYHSIGRVKGGELYDQSPIKMDSVYFNGKLPARINVQYIDREKFEIVQNPSAMHAFGEWVTTKWGGYSLRFDSLCPLLEGTIDIQFRKIENQALKYTNSLSVKPMSSYSSVLELKLIDPVPAKGINILNTLVETYNEAAIEDKNKASRSTFAFIEDRLRYLTSELADVEGSAQRYKQRNEIGIKIEKGIDLVMDELALLDQEVSTLEVQRSVLKSMNLYLRSNSSQYQLIPANLSTQDGQLSVLINRFNEQALERERIQRTAKADNPVLIGMTQQLNSLYANILETISKVDKRLETNLDQTRAKRDMLTGKVRQAPRLERELQEIMRQQAIKQNLYLYLLQKREETALSLATAVPNSRVVDSARYNKKPVFPDPIMLYTLALVLGLGLSALLVWILEMLNDKVQSEEDIRKMTDAPIIGGVSQGVAGQNLVASADSRSPAAEMFRLLRTNLQFLNPEQKQQTVLITSTSSGEGKTYIAVNLALTLALSNKKTIILGLDLRKPKLASYLGKGDAENGLSTYLAGQTSSEAIIHHSKLHPALDFIASGLIPPNPAELILLDKLAELIKDLQNRYDFVIIDSPPIGLVADAFMLSRFANTCLYVVRHNETRKGMLKLLDDIYRQNRLPNLAIVLNGLNPNLDYGNGYGYGYGYGYGHGYGGYYDEAKPKTWWQKLLPRKKK